MLFDIIRNFFNILPICWFRIAKFMKHSRNAGRFDKIFEFDHNYNNLIFIQGQNIFSGHLLNFLKYH